VLFWISARMIFLISSSVKLFPASASIAFNASGLG